ncbi:MAG: helix-turn-helix transcriptional regulator [Eubacteriales bacterium]|nr:helix-turn-helix transcriptional regulator [Eubacteriales bacterium]
MFYGKDELHSMGIRGVTILAGVDGVFDVPLPSPSSNEFLFIVCAAGTQGFYLNNSLIELKAGEILYLNEYSGPVSVRSQAERVRLYLMGVVKEEGAFGVTEPAAVENIFLNIYKYYVQYSRASDDLIRYFDRVFGFGPKRYDQYRPTVIDGCVKLIFNELNTCCHYRSISGADWSGWEAASFCVALENPSPFPVTFFVRVDSESVSDGFMEGVLIGDDGTRTEQGESYYVVVPSGFSGIYSCPLKPEHYVSHVIYHTETGLDLKRVVRLVMSVGDHAGGEQIPGRIGTTLRIGAMDLRDKNGVVVRSLSYFTDLRGERTLTEEQFALIFNKQYYVLNGMEVTFDGMIRCTQVAPASTVPFICTVMGAERHCVTRFPDDVAVALTYIHEHFREELRVDDLAVRVFLSPSRFKEKFRACTGFSPLKYIDWLRIRAAKDAINQNGGGSLTALAYELGFSSPSHFSYVFRRQAGVTPTQYRAAVSRRV